MQTVNLHSKLQLIISEKSDGNIDYRFGGKDQVAKHRHQLFSEVNLDPKQIFELDQVHGSDIIIADQVPDIPPQADGLITQQKNLSLMLKTADCLPLVIFDPVNLVVALIHVGWRGAIQKIYLHALVIMQHHFHSHLKDLIIWLGPSLLPCCCHKADPPLQTYLPEWQPFIKHLKSGWQIDYPGFVIDNLTKLGINPSQIQNLNSCTYCQVDSWFSYKYHQDTGSTDGRFATIVKLLEN